MRKRPIPQVPRSAAEQGRVAFDAAMKENLEIILGHRGGAIAPLTADSSASEIVDKINEIISRLQ